MVSSSYDQYLQANLSLVERLSGNFSGLDERLDYLNRTLTRLIELQGGGTSAPSYSSDMQNLIKSVDAMTVSLNKLVVGLGGTEVGRNYPGIASQVKVVPTAGTAVQLPPATVPYGESVVVKALRDNDGTIYVAGNKDDAQGHTNAFPFKAGEGIGYKIRNVNLLWIDASISGEGMAWSVEQEAF